MDTQADGQLFSRLPHSIKRPGKARVWYAYPDQWPHTARIGSWCEPTRVGRVLDDGTAQITETSYNSKGSVLSQTDARGRQTTYTYAANGVDLLEVRQTNGGGSDLLASYSNYNLQHQPQTVTDAAGRTTSFTYNAAGQVLTVTNAKNETTTYTYDANGGLQSVTGPVSSSTTSYMYDGYGRVRTRADSAVRMSQDTGEPLCAVCGMH